MDRAIRPSKTMTSCPDCAVKKGKKNAKEKNEQKSDIGHPRNYSWSELMKRVFGLDILKCDRCGGRILSQGYVLCS
jgi:hypothetical protein